MPRARTSILQKPSLLTGSLFAVGLVLLSGCYDGQAMVERVAQRMADDHLREIDLGTYQITLPRDPRDPVATTVRLEIVATVERRHARAFERELAEVETPLRHATVMALRQCERADLLEPDLTTLHERIRTTTEEYLTAGPIQEIVFRSLAVYED